MGGAGGGRREEVRWGLKPGRDYRGLRAGKREAGVSSGGWGRRGRDRGPPGFCSVVSQGISDSKVNCGVLSLPSSNKQCLECLMFPSHRTS